jgi:hypothetical protein
MPQPSPSALETIQQQALVRENTRRVSDEEGQYEAAHKTNKPQVASLKM